ncbi:hypothetical protein GCM10018966_086230 [Streptomyces yanii]
MTGTIRLTPGRSCPAASTGTSGSEGVRPSNGSQASSTALRTACQSSRSRPPDAGGGCGRRGRFGGLGGVHEQQFGRGADTGAGLAEHPEVERDAVRGCRAGREGDHGTQRAAAQQIGTDPPAGAA